MKKLLSIILTITMLCSMAIAVFADDKASVETSAENTQNYEYILPIEYTGIDRQQNCYIAYGKQEKCAIYDLNGEKLSDGYDYIGSFFNEQAAAARKDNESYIINPYGTVLGKFDKRIIDAADYVLVNLTDSNEDGRPLSYFEGEFGVYTYSGELVKVLPYEEFKPPKNWGFWITFAGGRLLFSENGKWGAVDNSFNTVIEPTFDRIYPFTDTENGITIAIKNSKFGLIDRDGNVIADFIYDSIEPLHNDNGKVNAYKVTQGHSENNDEKFGLLDKHGKMIKQLDESEPRMLYEYYELIQVSKKNNRDDSEQYGDLYGIINYDGNIVIPVENTNIWGISEGIVAAQKSSEHSGYYDISGREITDFNYGMISLFSDGLAFAENRVNGAYEVINKNGEVVFNTSGFANGFYGGIAQIEAGKFIDTSGKVVIDNPKWKPASESGLNWWSYKNDGRFIVSDGENYGVAKYTGFISPWAKESVSEAKRLNIIKTDGNYNYTAFISREEFCEMIYSYLENVAKISLNTDNEMPFDDTNNEHIGALYSLEIISGKSRTMFAPDYALTREEAAAIICRMINKIYPNYTATEQYFDFADSDQVSAYAMDNIQTLCNMGIMNGVGDNRFAPQDLYTTEQAITTLVRVYENAGNISATINKAF